nr:putative CXCR1 isoform II [Gallus gallus]
MGTFYADELLDILYNYTSDYCNYSLVLPDIDVSSSPCRNEGSVANKYLVAFIYCLAFLLSMVGNGLVVLVVTSGHINRSVTDVYLLNLAVDDLLFALSLPLWAVYWAHEWVFGTVMCKAILVLQESNFYSGILLLACISVDRYLAIVYGTRAATEKRHWVKFVCVGIWVFSVLLSLPVLLFREAFVSDRNGTVCYERIGNENTTKWRVVLRVLRRPSALPCPSWSCFTATEVTVHTLLQTKNVQKQRAMKVILAVVLVFLVCWLPYNITLVSDTLMRTRAITETCERRKHIDTALSITQVLGFSTVASTPSSTASSGRSFATASSRSWHSVASSARMLWHATAAPPTLSPLATPPPPSEPHCSPRPSACSPGTPRTPAS